MYFSFYLSMPHQPEGQMAENTTFHSPVDIIRLCGSHSKYLEQEFKRNTSADPTLGMESQAVHTTKDGSGLFQGLCHWWHRNIFALFPGSSPHSYSRSTSSVFAVETETTWFLTISELTSVLNSQAISDALMTQLIVATLR